MMHSALYLSAKRKLGELLDREGVERLPSGVHLHSTQHHDDGGHDQSQETTGVDDDVGVLGLHGVHSVCCFLLYKSKGKWYIRTKTGSFFVLRYHSPNLLLQIWSQRYQVFVLALCLMFDVCQLGAAFGGVTLSFRECKHFKQLSPHLFKQVFPALNRADFNLFLTWDDGEPGRLVGESDWISCQTGVLSCILHGDFGQVEHLHLWHVQTAGLHNTDAEKVT